MPAADGGFLIQFDEAKRAELLHDVRDLESGFSDALSSRDWKVRQWDVCGLMFKPNTITHWALAQRGRTVATGKVRVNFTEVTATALDLDQIKIAVLERLRNNIGSARTGVGGRVPPATWTDMKRAIGEIDRDSLLIVERLELLRDQSRTKIERSGASIVAQQRDAVGVALDVFDQSAELRRTTLKAWTAPEGPQLSSFLDGLPNVRTIEDQHIALDASVFPGSDKERRIVTGTVFALGDRKLEVFNVNRTAVERSLGVDLIYWNEAFDAWTLVQYKVMENSGTGTKAKAIYRPDASFMKELKRMQDFYAGIPISANPLTSINSYRLASDGFYFKLCSRVQLDVLSDSLLPGMYLPREYVELLLADNATLGTSGGRTITFANVQRHISNTWFAELVRDGWVGTKGAASSQIRKILPGLLSAGHSIVLARSRPEDIESDMSGTICELGIGLDDGNNNSDD